MVSENIDDVEATLVKLEARDKTKNKVIATLVVALVTVSALCLGIVGIVMNRNRTIQAVHAQEETAFCMDLIEAKWEDSLTLFLQKASVENDLEESRRIIAQLIQAGPQQDQITIAQEALNQGEPCPVEPVEFPRGGD